MEMKDYERSVNELKKTVESAQEEAESYKKGIILCKRFSLYLRSVRTWNVKWDLLLKHNFR